MPGTRSGKPAARAIQRPTQGGPPVASDWAKTTSSIRLGSIPDRSSTAFTTILPNRSTGIDRRLPPKIPTGVRTGLTMAARLIAIFSLQQILVTTRHAEDMLRQISQDHICRNWRNLIKTRLAKLSLNVVFLGETKSAVGLYANVRCLPRRVSGKHLCHICFGTTRKFRLVSASRIVNHELGRAHCGIGLGNGKLDALILADRPTKHFAVTRVFDRCVGKPFRIANTFCGDQNALRVHAGQYVTKALTFLADQVSGWNNHVVKKDFACAVVHHRPNRAYC